MVELKEILTTPLRSAKSYAQLCPWFSLLPSEEMILCQDGTLLAGFKLKGIDPEGVEDDTLSSQIDILQKSLSGMSENIICWSFVEKKKVKRHRASEYQNPIAQIIDNDWVDSMGDDAQFEVTHSIYFGYRKVNMGDSFIESVNHKINEEGMSFPKALISAAISAMSNAKTVASIRGHLNEYEVEFTKLLKGFFSIGSLLLGIERLKGEELLGTLFSRMNIASPTGPIRPSRNTSYLPQKMSADKMVRRGNQLKFQGPSKSRNVAIISTTDYPDDLNSEHIDNLLSLPYEFCISQTYEFINRENALKQIQKMEMHLRMEVKSLGTRVAERMTGKEIDKVDTGNLYLAEDAQSAVIEITSNNMTYGFFSMRIMAYGETEEIAEDAVDMLAGTLRAYGYPTTRESTGLLGVFLATLPGNSRINPRKYLASVANVADLCPIRGFNRGEASNKFLSDVLGKPVQSHITFQTESSITYGFNFHEFDLGHSLLVGGSGGGKTTFMNLAIAMFQKYGPCNTYIFDRDYSTSVMSVLLGGKHLDINTTGEAKVQMNPVKRMLDNGDAIALYRWICMLIVGENSEPLTAKEEADINQVVQQMKGMNRLHWRLGTFFTQLCGTNKQLALRMVKYVDTSNGQDSTGVGQYSSFFDNDDDAFELSSFVCIETGKLLKIPDLAAPFLEYAFYAVNKSLNGQTPTLIYIEEASFALKNPQFYNNIEDWLRTLRKLKAFVVMSTQGLSELDKLPDLSGFLTNMPTRIFLPSITNTVKENTELYKKIFNLNDCQLDKLASAIPKRDYLIVKANETKLVRAVMPKSVVAINNACAIEHKRNRALDLSKSSAPGWDVEYLMEIVHA